MALHLFESLGPLSRAHLPFDITSTVPATRSALRAALHPVVSALGIRETFAWRRIRHGVSLLSNERVNSHFTGFLRLPAQFDVLTGTIARSFVESRRTDRLRIAVLGCSNGAEAYSIASVLKRHYPAMGFEVRAYDISPDCVRTGRTAVYRAEEVYNNRLLSAEFVCSTFNQQEGALVVKDDIARHVHFDVADIRNDLMTTVGLCDVVFAQNVLFHMPRPVARRTLRNIAALLRRDSFLFIDGVDLDLRARLTKRMGLAPVTDSIEQIHNEARRARAAGWPYHYWGLEPYCDGPHAARRYATIFRVP